MAKRVLLTGASGFIGRHLVQELEGYELWAISHSRKSIEGVSHVFAWDKLDNIEGEFEAIVHLAGLAHDTQNQSTEDDYFAVNKGLTKQLLSHCDRLNVKTFVYLSSVKAVVDSTCDEKIDELTPCSPSHVYGRSKLAAEQVIDQTMINAPRVILRPVMVYGPGQKGNLKTLEKLLSLRIPFPFGKWKNKRSVLFVGNLTSCIKTIIEKKPDSGTYFIADDQSVSTVDLLRLIAKGIGVKPLFIPTPNGLIKGLLKLMPARVHAITNKVLGSLEVDNQKLKSALSIEEMPFSTIDGFEKTFQS